MSVDLEQEVQRGRMAQSVLDNAVYKEAFLVIRAKIMEDFSATDFKQSEERDELWRKMQTLDRIESYLTDVMRTGKFATEQLSLLQKGLQKIGL